MFTVSCDEIPPKSCKEQPRQVTGCQCCAYPRLLGCYYESRGCSSEASDALGVYVAGFEGGFWGDSGDAKGFAYGVVSEVALVGVEATAQNGVF